MIIIQTVRTKIRQFLDELSNNNTRATYRTALIQFKQYAYSRQHPNLIDGEYKAIRKLVKDWLFESSNRWSDKTVAAKLAAVSRFYKWLLDEGDRDNNPATSIMVHRSENLQDRKYPDSRLADRLITVLTKHAETSMDRRALIAVRMLREGGFRASELVRLKFNDVDPSGVVVIRRGKRSKSRRTAVLPETAELISNYQAELDLMPSNCVFGTKYFRREHILPGSVYELLERYCRKHGMDEEQVKICRSPHAWRHLWTTEHVQAGTSLPQLMAMGGWTSARMISLYTDNGQMEVAAVRREPDKEIL